MPHASPLICMPPPPCRRTSTLRKNHEGVLVAWRQEELQALRVEHVSLNDAILEEPEVRRRHSG